MEAILQKYDKKANRLMDILIDIQSEKGHICEKTIDQVAAQLNISTVDVEQTMSFYHFFTKKSSDYTVYLNDSAVACMKGRDEVAKAFEEATGNKFGVNESGKIGLYNTADIGMNDQEPAALINGKVFTNLTAAKAKELVEAMNAGKAVEDMTTEYGDGVNAQIKSMVKNNIMNEGKVLFTAYESGTAIKKAIAMQPTEVVAEVKASNIRGRGGAGFPTGMKWEFTAAAEGSEKFVICNADEGEPGIKPDNMEMVWSLYFLNIQDKKCENPSKPTTAPTALSLRYTV